LTARAVRVRQTFVLEDASGDELARIQERKLAGKQAGVGEAEALAAT
jgi:hypothetical protein